MSTPRRRSSGFTIFELTVVITIIAILAAILFPVFSQATHSARYSACRVNLYQLGAALRVYASDHDGHFPPRDNDLSPLAAGYLRQRDPSRTLVCPVDTEPWRVGPPGGALLACSYQYRPGLSPDGPAGVPLAADWAHHHNKVAAVLLVDGSVITWDSVRWVPFALEPPPLSDGSLRSAVANATWYLADLEPDGDAGEENEEDAENGQVGRAAEKAGPKE